MTSIFAEARAAFAGEQWLLNYVDAYERAFAVNAHLNFPFLLVGLDVAAEASVRELLASHGRRSQPICAFARSEDGNGNSEESLGALIEVFGNGKFAKLPASEREWHALVGAVATILFLGMTHPAAETSLKTLTEQ